MRRRPVHFEDRREAGRELARAVEHLRADAPVVLGLPRGGVVVAAEVARALGAPLDVVVVRKLGAPFQPEYAVGAVGEDGIVVVDDPVVDALELRTTLPRLVERERRELQRRIDRYRRGRTGIDVRGRTVVLVDDGIATGATARAAAEVTRRRGARRIALAVPVGPKDVAERFAGVVDEVVCLVRPDDFRAVGSVYDAFEATEDDEVERLLAETPAGPAP